MQYSLRSMLLALTMVAAWLGLLVAYPFAAVIVVLSALLLAFIAD